MRQIEVERFQVANPWSKITRFYASPCIADRDDGLSKSVLDIRRIRLRFLAISPDRVHLEQRPDTLLDCLRPLRVHRENGRVHSSQTHLFLGVVAVRGLDRLHRSV